MKVSNIVSDFKISNKQILVRYYWLAVIAFLKAYRSLCYVVCGFDTDTAQKIVKTHNICAGSNYAILTWN